MFPEFKLSFCLNNFLNSSVSFVFHGFHYEARVSFVHSGRLSIYFPSFLYSSGVQSCGQEIKVNNIQVNMNIEIFFNILFSFKFV